MKLILKILIYLLVALALIISIMRLKCIGVFWKPFVIIQDQNGRIYDELKCVLKTEFRYLNWFK